MTFVSSSSLAADPAPSSLESISYLIDNFTLAVGRVDVRRVDGKRAFDLLTLLFPPETPFADVAAEREKADANWKQLAELGGHSVYLIFRLPQAKEGGIITVIPYGEGVDRQSIEQWLRRAGARQIEHKPGIVWVTDEPTSKVMRGREPEPRADLAEALRESPDSSVQFAVAIHENFRRLVAAVFPELPPPLGGGKSERLIVDASWVTISGDLAPRASLRLDARFARPETATELEERLKKLTAFLGALPEVQRAVPDAEGFFSRLEPRAEGNRVEVVVGESDAKVLFNRVFAEQLALLRAQQQQNKLRENIGQIGQGLLAYEAANKRFPAAANYDEQGRARLSWRVHILPFVGQRALYEQFHLEEPWDSPHNLMLVKSMPALYGSPGAEREATEGKTVFVVPVGKGTIFESRKGTPARDITDGTSNTLLAVATLAPRAVIWTKPDDWEFDPSQPTRGLIDEATQELVAVLADGSVHAFPRAEVIPILGKLAQMNDGEPVR